MAKVKKFSEKKKKSLKKCAASGKFTLGKVSVLKKANHG